MFQKVIHFDGKILQPMHTHSPSTHVFSLVWTAWVHRLPPHSSGILVWFCCTFWGRTTYLIFNLISPWNLVTSCMTGVAPPNLHLTIHVSLIGQPKNTQVGV